MIMRYSWVVLIVLLSCCDVPSPQNDYKAVVIGGGLMGSSAAWHLALGGDRVLLIEQQSKPPYAKGSSQGKSRIARSFGPPDDIWSYLHNTTVKEVKELIRFLNERDTTAHHMEDIYTTSPMNYVRHIKQKSRIEPFLLNQKDSVVYASSSQVAKELFDMNISDTTIVLREYKKHTGTINPEALIQKLHRAVELVGSTIHYDTKVTNISTSDQGYRIETNSTISYTIETENIFFAAGPYNGTLLQDISPSIKDLIIPQRVFLGYYRIKDDVYHNLGSLGKNKLYNGYPAINSSLGTRDGGFFTMFEEIDDTGNPLIKIGGHFQRSNISDMDAVWSQALSEEEINWTREKTILHLNQLDLDILPKDLILEKEYSCVYSLTANEVPIISHLIDHNGNQISSAIILGGLSGVGGKGSLAYGKLAADMYYGKTSDDPLYTKVIKQVGISRLQRDFESLSN